MNYFNDQNTEGYSAIMLAKLNEIWRELFASKQMTDDEEKYYRERILSMFDSQILRIEGRVLEEMELPSNTMTLDGDAVLNNRKDYRPTDHQREVFRHKVEMAVKETSVMIAAGI